MSLTRVSAIAVPLALVVLGISAFAAHRGKGDDGSPGGITSHHVSKSERGTSVWTPERMKNAKPMPFPSVPGSPSANLPPGKAQKPTKADPPTNPK